METHRRKADGRRVFTPQCKLAQVVRIQRQELTVAPQLIRQWQRLCNAGSTVVVTANEASCP